MSIRGKVRPTGTYIGLTSGASAAVSEANEGRIRYNTALSRLEASEDAGPYFPFGVGAGASFTVANMAALTATPDGPLVDGTIAAMHSVMGLWQLRKTGTDAPNASTIIATNSGVGRWYRLRQQNEFWRSQTTWHINETTGDDENDGLTGPTAISTWAELIRRLGAGSCTGAVYAVYLDSDLTQNISVTDLVDATFFVTGSRTVIYSGSVSATDAWQATPVPTRGTITDATIPVSWTASGLVGQMIVGTSGAIDGYCAWVQLDNGAKQAQHSVFFSFATFLPADPGVGDTFDVVTLTKITGTVSCGSNSLLVFTDCNLDGNGSYAVFCYSGAYLGLVNCLVENGGVRASQECQLDSYCSRYAHNITSASFDFNGRLWSTFDAVEVAINSTYGGSVLILGYTVSQYIDTIVGSSGQFYIGAGYWWGMFDNPAASPYGLRFNEDADSRLRGLFWGLGNSSDYGIVVASGKQVSYDVDPTYGPNVVNDVLVGSIADTYAALPIADGTLLAGLVTAT